MSEKNLAPMVYVIPAPAECTFKQGYVTFTSSDRVIAQTSADTARLAKYLCDCLKEDLGETCFPIQVGTPPGSGKSIDSDSGTKYISLQVRKQPPDGSSEYYELEVGPTAIEVTGASPQGLFYGIQTLRQLFPVGGDPTITPPQWTIPCLKIVDSPRFQWRGFMMDVGRRFLPLPVIKQMLDLLALLKLNVFHWHLTEDQGWRLEIKRFPKLTKIGSWRRASPLYRFIVKRTDNTPHGGFYTHEDVREILQYAADRFITVIPEIEMPGHSQAALAAYPEFSCTGGPFEVSTRWNIHQDVYCVGKEATVSFLKAVLDEVMEIFPSQVIHIGGDEVPKARWKKCPDCQRKMRELHLPSEHALQVAFTNDLARYLASKGRRLMGWNEILDDDLLVDAICHHWMGPPEKLVDHVKRGRDVVRSWNRYCYLNYRYAKLPLKRVYSFNPMLKGLSDAEQRHVLGIEAPVWGEVLYKDEHLFWFAFPRLLAVAEVAWTPLERKDFTRFLPAARQFVQRLANLGIPYTPELFWGEKPPRNWNPLPWYFKFPGLKK